MIMSGASLAMSERIGNSEPGVQDCLRFSFSSRRRFELEQMTEPGFTLDTGRDWFSARQLSQLIFTEEWGTHFVFAKWDEHAPMRISSPLKILKPGLHWRCPFFPALGRALTFAA